MTTSSVCLLLLLPATVVAAASRAHLFATTQVRASAARARQCADWICALGCVGAYLCTMTTLLRIVQLRSDWSEALPELLACVAVGLDTAHITAIVYRDVCVCLAGWKEHLPITVPGELTKIMTGGFRLSVHPRPWACCCLGLICVQILWFTRGAALSGLPFLTMTVGGLLRLPHMNRPNILSPANGNLGMLGLLILSLRKSRWLQRDWKKSLTVWIWAHPWHLAFFLVFLGSTLLWHQHGWMEEEIGMLSDLRSALEQQGIRFKPFSPPPASSRRRVTAGHKATIPLVSLLENDELGDIQGMDLQSLCKDEDGEVGHKFAVIEKAAGDLSKSGRRKKKSAKLSLVELPRSLEAEHFNDNLISAILHGGAASYHFTDTHKAREQAAGSI